MTREGKEEKGKKRGSEKKGGGKEKEKGVGDIEIDYEGEEKVVESEGGKENGGGKRDRKVNGSVESLTEKNEGIEIDTTSTKEKEEDNEEKEGEPVEKEIQLISQVSCALSLYSNQLTSLNTMMTTAKKEGGEREEEWEERISCVIGSLRCVIEDLHLAQTGLRDKREGGREWDGEYVRKVVIVQCQVFFSFFFS